MKKNNITTLLLFSGALTFLISCEKNNAGILDDTFKPIEMYNTNSNAATPDSTQFARIKEELDPEFTAMYGEFERLDPTLFKAWKKDLERYDTASNDAVIEAISSYMKTEYKSIQDQVMVNLNFDKAQIRQRIQAILGTIPFEIGPYLNVYGVQTLSGSSAIIPQDTVYRLGNNFQRRQLNGCNTLRSTTTTNGFRLNSLGPIAAWCNARAEVGNMFRIPERYRNMRVEFKIKSGYLRVNVGGLGGFSAESKLFARLKPVSGQDGRTTTRQMAAIWTAAAAWSSDIKLDLDGLGMTIAERCGVFEGDAEVHLIGETLVRSGGLGSSHSSIRIDVVDAIDAGFFN